MSAEGAGAERPGGTDAASVRVGGQSPGGVSVTRLETARGESTWVLGDGEECVVIDPVHEPPVVLEVVGERRLTAVLCTGVRPGAPALLSTLLDARPRTRLGVHVADLGLWRSESDVAPNLELADGDIISAGDVEITVLHTPGTTPGSCCLHVPDLAMLFSGGTQVSRLPALLDLDAETLVLPARGEPVRLGELRDGPA